MFSSGPSSLADYELIAVLLRTGMKGESVLDLSKRILKNFGGLEGIKSITLEELNSVKGIGKAKSAQVMAAIELGRRFSMISGSGKKIKINTPDDVYDYLHYEMESLDHEELWVVSLDTRNCVMAVDKLYQGSLNTSTVRIAEIFKLPVVRKAHAIILVHNHPSGDPKPSAADIMTTNAVKEAGANMEIRLLDHIIIGKGDFKSINDHCK